MPASTHAVCSSAHLVAVATLLAVATVGPPPVVAKSEEESPTSSDASDTDQAKAKRLHQKAMEASDAGEHARAAQLFDQAHDLYPDVVLLWNAARSHHQAGHLEKARKRYERVLRKDELPADYRPKAAQYLADIQVALKKERSGPQEEEPSKASDGSAGARRGADAESSGAGERTKSDEEASTSSGRRGDPTATGVATKQAADVAGPAPWAWAPTVGGAALVAAGIGLHFAAEGKRDEVRAARRRGPEGVVAMPEDEAKARRSKANTLDRAGAATMAIGGAAAATGIVLLFTTRSDRPGSAVGFGGTPVRGGGLVTASGRF